MTMKTLNVVEYKPTVPRKILMNRVTKDIYIELSRPLVGYYFFNVTQGVNVGELYKDQIDNLYVQLESFTLSI